MQKSIITTTINKPTKAIKKYANIKGWDLIVVGDKKTPHKYYKQMKNIIYLDPTSQTSINKKLSKLIGWNCVQRRNFGFILAYNLGYDIIATVDDDNIPYDNWGKDIIINKPYKFDKYYTDKSSFFDPLFPTKYKNLWHRGFPLQEVNSRNILYKDTKLSSCLVQANFWNGNPDVDALCRILHKPNVKFNKFRYFITDAMVPFNSQNTFIHKSLLPFYMMIPHVGRMDDIWGAYILQQIMTEINIAFGKATVYQDRNEHNLINDLKKEIIGYENSYKFANENYTKILPKKSLLAFYEYRRSYD